MTGLQLKKKITLNSIKSHDLALRQNGGRYIVESRDYQKIHFCLMPYAYISLNFLINQGFKNHFNLGNNCVEYAQHVYFKISTEISYELHILGCIFRGGGEATESP